MEAPRSAGPEGRAGAGRGIAAQTATITLALRSVAAASTSALVSVSESAQRVAVSRAPLIAATAAASAISDHAKSDRAAPIPGERHAASHDQQRPDDHE